VALPGLHLDAACPGMAVAARADLNVHRPENRIALTPSPAAPLQFPDSDFYNYWSNPAS
jgi:hypothetical protein